MALDTNQSINKYIQIQYMNHVLVTPAISKLHCIVPLGSNNMEKNKYKNVYSVHYITIGVRYCPLLTCSRHDIAETLLSWR